MINLIKRTVPVILVLIVCITCLVFPAAASSFEVPDAFYNVLDYATPNDFSTTGFSLPDSQGSVSFDISGTLLFNYVDMVVTSTSKINRVNIGGTNLTIREISAGVFRIFGDIPYAHYSELLVSFYCSSSSVLNFISFHAFNDQLTPKSLIGIADFYDADGLLATKQQSSPSTTTSYTFPITAGATGLEEIIIDLSAADWNKYDYLAFRFRTRLNVKSIIGMSDDGVIPLPITVTEYRDWADTQDSLYFYCIVDISSLQKDGDRYPIVQVRCNRRGEYSGVFNFYDATGFVNVEYVDPNLSFFRKFQKVISEKIDGVIDELKKITGTGADSDAISAQQKQEELNVSINNQLVGAVEDWNTNIEIVETGYDMAIANVSSPLVWLASLADGVFNGMGWFGNIYFLIGLISVIMLVLSKSGLARSIGRLRRD